MKEYKIYANPQGAKEAVKQGWSWPAFFFNLIWALVKKMWSLGIGLFVLYIMLGIIEGVIEETYGKGATFIFNGFSAILNIIVYLALGIKGNIWREKNLQSRGYDYQDTISAANPDEAIALWVKEHHGNRTGKGEQTIAE